MCVRFLIQRAKDIQETPDSLSQGGLQEEILAHHIEVMAIVLAHRGEQTAEWQMYEAPKEENGIDKKMK